MISKVRFINLGGNTIITAPHPYEQTLRTNANIAFTANSGTKNDSIDFSFRSEDADYSHRYIGEMKMSKDGKTLYAVEIDSGIFNTKKVLSPFEKKFDWKSVKGSTKIDEEEACLEKVRNKMNIV